MRDHASELASTRTSNNFGTVEYPGNSGYLGNVM